MSVREVVVPAVQMTTHGVVSVDDRDYLVHKLQRVLEVGGAPVLGAQMTVRAQRTGSRQAPEIYLEAEVNVNGHPVRAHVTASTVREGGDLLQERLRSRLTHRGDRVTARRRQSRKAVQSFLGTSGFELDGREVVRRKLFAVDPMTASEAAAEMEQLGHDFYLYHDSLLGQDAVVCREGDDVHADGYALTVVAPRLSEAQAVERLACGGERFVLYRDAQDGRSRVLYLRRDGNLGLIASE